MQRVLGIAVGIAMIGTFWAGEARAQWGWGFDGWGWGGWGVGTAESTELQAAGQFAMGAGIYNLKTAEANFINAQTAIKWNDYVAQVTHESARIHAARRDSRVLRNRELYDARRRQLRDNPGKREIENGDALNLAVEDLSDPRVGPSALKAARTKIPASLVATIPFLYASERITLMLEGLRQSVKWPDVFEGERFTAEKKSFDEIAARLRREADEGDVSSRSVRDAREFLRGLRAKLDAQPLREADHQEQARAFLTACTSLLDLFEKPNIGPALLDLRKVQETQVANLLGFMSAYNLRFGPATTPEQRRAYAELYEILGKTRNQILAEAKLGPERPADPKAITEFFQDLEKGRAAKGTPPPAR